MRSGGEKFLSKVEAFLKRTGMTPTALGVAALGDPNFVRDIRAGRMPTYRVSDKVEAFIAKYRRPARPRRRSSSRLSASV
jgi:hypothetical protein